ncbi:MAG: FG-GAP-like repeat-containing protein, partial [Pseudomonadota bacterium]
MHTSNPSLLHRGWPLLLMLASSCNQEASDSAPLPVIEPGRAPGSIMDSGLDPDALASGSPLIVDDSRSFREPQPGRFTASALGIRAVVDASGLQASRGDAAVTLRFAAWGREGAAQPVEPTAPMLGACSRHGEELPDGSCLQRVELPYPGLTEFWQTAPLGLEQGWEIDDRPAGDGLVTLDLQIDGAIRWEVDRGGSSASLLDSEGRSWRYAGLEARDARGLPLVAWMERSAEGLRLFVDDRQADYPILVDPVLSSETKLLAPDGASDDAFGFFSTAAGDVNADSYPDVIVGSAWDDDDGADSGAVWVYYGSSTGITSLDATKLTAPDAAPGDLFGWSAAAAGDVNCDGFGDVIVGVRNDDDNGVEAGAAWVFYGGPGISTLGGTKLLAPDGGAGDEFGYAVSSAGDINGDAFADVIVGAWNDDDSGTDAGAAYVFLGGPDGAAVLGTRLLASDGTGGDNFGGSVSGAGDVNADGFADVIVGAYRHDSGAGAAYVVLGGISGITASETKLTDPGGMPSDGFGISVSSAGDVNGDGFADVIVGEFQDDDLGMDSGSAWVFYGSSAGTTTSGAAQLFASDGAASDSFGFSVSGAGDVNGDGFADVIVGAPEDADAGASSGSAYVFFGGGGGIDPSIELKLVASDGSAYDHFGTVVSGAGDIDRDGQADVIVGAPDDDDNGDSSGSVYVFAGEPTGPASPSDADGDGWTVEDGDCDDTDFFSSPGAPEDCYDGLDNNCNGLDDALDPECIGTPCEPEICEDLVDNDCDGWVDYDDPDCGTDADGDGCTIEAGDCDDSDPGTFPAAGEDCYDGRDNNCDGWIDFDDWYCGGSGGGPDTDVDRDGWTLEGGDCDDGDPLVNPGMSEDCFDMLDNNCDSLVDLDDPECGGMACEPEICGDGLDNDCDGRIDDGDPDCGGVGGGAATCSTWLVCAAGCGGDPDCMFVACAPADPVEYGLWYDFLICASMDCGGMIDETCMYATCAAEWDACEGAGGGTTDTDGDGNPDETDPCPYDPEDDSDLDGSCDSDDLCPGLDDSGATSWYLDGDGDGYGDPTVTVQACVQPSGYAALPGDCDDSVPCDTDPAESRISASDGISGDSFGGSAADAGDVNADGYADLIVGAFRDDDSGIDSGSAYVYLGGPGGVDAASEAHLLAPGGAAGDYFGFSVAGAGDVDADGYDDVIVGAYEYDGGHGAAWVFHGSATGIDPADYTELECPDCASSGIEYRFGFSVAGAGDVNGDGYADVIVGKPYDDANGTYAGAAWVYLGSAAGIASSGTRLEASDGATHDQLGAAVAGAGDVNGDGYADVIVGTKDYGDAAYLFLGGAAGVSQASETILSNPGTAGSTAFGSSVAGAGDVNADGYDDLLVGDYLGSDNGSYSGAAWLYLGGSAGIDPATAIIVFASDPASQDYYGYAVTGAGDMDGDGYDDVAVGAYRDDDSQTDAGSIYLYRGSAGGIDLGSEAEIHLASPRTNGYFGAHIARAGDVDGNGRDDLFAGNSTWGTRAGAVYVFAAAGPCVPSWYPDADGDGYGTAVGAVQACEQPSGTVSNPLDCDDAVATCTGNCRTDADADSVIDCLDTCLDADEDGYGFPGGAGDSCTASDCDDSVASCSDDCSTDVDSDGIYDCADTCIDADGDNYGTAGGGGNTCTAVDCLEGNANCDSDCTDADSDNYCVNHDCDETAATCTTDCVTNVDGDATPDCKDTCIDADGDNYGTAGGGGNTCTAVDCLEGNANCDSDCTDADSDNYCVNHDCDETAATCTTDCVTNVDGDATPDCKDTCIDADGDNYGTAGGGGNT